MPLTPIKSISESDGHLAQKVALPSELGWWSLWGGSFVLSLVSPFVHHWRHIAEVVEPFRYHDQVGLLPAHLLALRNLGQLSLGRACQASTIFEWSFCCQLSF